MCTQVKPAINFLHGIGIGIMNVITELQTRQTNAFELSGPQPADG